MRAALKFCLIAGFAIMAGTAANAEEVSYDPNKPWYDPSEISLGGGATDPTMQKELSPDITGELLIQPLGNSDWPRFLRARPQIGFNYDTSGKTSYGYAGFTFDFLNFHHFFVDGSLDVSVHDGHLHGDATHRALGSREEFREAASFGYQFAPDWAASVYIDHQSNAGLFSSINQGIETTGVRFSYLFNNFSNCCQTVRGY